MKMRKIFLRNQDGGVLIFMALAIAVLIAAVGLAIDAGRIFLVNSKAQIALDAAVVSAAAVSYQPVDAADRAALNALVEQRGDDFFVANFPSGFMGVTAGAGNATFFPTDGDGTTVRGNLNLTVNTFFGDFALSFFDGGGSENVNMAEFAEVQRVIPDIDFEIALALDYTKSMCEFEIGRNCSNSRFANMRESTNLLIDTLQASLQATTGDTTIHYAFVPFTHRVRLNNDENDLNPAFFFGNQRRDTIDSLPNTLGLRTDTNAIKDALNNIVPEENTTSGTNVGVGAYWGWLALRQDSQSEFRGVSAHARIPAPRNDEETYKMMILLTDGENLASYFNENRDPMWLDEPDLQADETQEAACNGAKNEGIEIRVVALGNLGARAEGLLQRCASEPVGGGDPFFYRVEDTDDADALRDVFRQIANDLIDLRISL